MSVGEHLEAYTYESLLVEALSKVPDTIDKREGSIIYDALAPACYALAEYYLNLRYFYEDAYILTATGKYLDYKVAEQGLTRYPASSAIKKGTFTAEDGTPFTIDVGSRFSTVASDPSQALIYYVKDKYEQSGTYQLECETVGTIGNSYIGKLLPITHINGLVNAYMDDLIQPGSEEETDNELRARYLDSVNTRSFGGNIAQYREETKSIKGVGDIQCYPVWNGGGTVLLSIVDSQYRACTSDFIKVVQNTIDPENSHGTGLGLAPIGHYVTVTTPTEVTININTNVKLLDGYTIGQVIDQITEALESYLNDLRTSWGKPNEDAKYYSVVYVSQITAVILKIGGIANVANTQINNQINDWVLTQKATAQEIPILGEVKLNEIS